MMKKNIFKIVMMCGILSLPFSNGLFAQSFSSRFSIGGELAMPTGNYGDRASTGFGGSLRYEVPLGTSPFALMATAGYLSFGSKSSDDAALNTYKYTNSMIPLQLGLKLYLTGQQRGFYVSGEAGVHLLSSKNSIVYNGITTSSNYNNTAFSYAPGIGYHFASVDIGLKYQLFSDPVTLTNPVNNESSTTTSTGSYLGLRIAFVF
jgi:hypothetical protein